MQYVGSQFADQGLNPKPPALEAWIPNHWTTGKSWHGILGCVLFFDYQSYLSVQYYLSLFPWLEKNAYDSKINLHIYN